MVKCNARKANQTHAWGKNEASYTLLSEQKGDKVNNVDTIITMVTQLGILPVIVGVLFYFMNKTLKENTQAIQENSIIIAKILVQLDKE